MNDYNKIRIKSHGSDEDRDLFFMFFLLTRKQNSVDDLRIYYNEVLYMTNATELPRMAIRISWVLVLGAMDGDRVYPGHGRYGPFFKLVT